MKTRVVIYADEGKVLTNGKTYGTQIFLAEGEDVDKYYEISKEEYEEIITIETEENSDFFKK